MQTYSPSGHGPAEEGDGHRLTPLLALGDGLTRSPLACGHHLLPPVQHPNVAAMLVVDPIG